MNPTPRLYTGGTGATFLPRGRDGFYINKYEFLGWSWPHVIVSLEKFSLLKICFKLHIKIKIVAIWATQMLKG